MHQCPVCGARHATCIGGDAGREVRPADAMEDGKVTIAVDVYEVEVRPGVIATLRLSAEDAKRYANARKVGAKAKAQAKPATTKKRTAKNKKG